MKKTRNVRWSESLHRKATRLLASCRLLQILRKHGEIRPWGSYAANLMMHGDIDFHVIIRGRCTKRKVLKACEEIALTDRFDRHSFCDFSKKFKGTVRTNGSLRGYYVAFETRYGDVRWRIDIWFLSAAEQAKDDLAKLNAMKMSITATQREAILAFKKIRNEADRPDFCSQRIYELVLMDGMTSRTKFKQLLAKG